MPNDVLDYENLITEDIFSLMGFKNLTNEKKKELTAKMLETIYARVIARIDSELSDEDKTAWSKLVDENKGDEAKQFLLSKGMDIDKMMSEETLIYKLEMTKSAETIRKQTLEELKNSKKGGQNE